MRMGHFRKIKKYKLKLNDKNVILILIPSAKGLYKLDI